MCRLARCYIACDDSHTNSTAFLSCRRVLVRADLKPPQPHQHQHGSSSSSIEGDVQLARTIFNQTRLLVEPVPRVRYTLPLWNKRTHTHTNNNNNCRPMLRGHPLSRLKHHTHTNNSENVDLLLHTPNPTQLDDIFWFRPLPHIRLSLVINIHTHTSVTRSVDSCSGLGGI